MGEEMRSSEELQEDVARLQEQTRKLEARGPQLDTVQQQGGEGPARFLKL